MASTPEEDSPPPASSSSSDSPPPPSEGSPPPPSSSPPPPSSSPPPPSSSPPPSSPPPPSSSPPPRSSDDSPPPPDQKSPPPPSSHSPPPPDPNSPPSQRTSPPPPPPNENNDGDSSRPPPPPPPKSNHSPPPPRSLGPPSGGSSSNDSPKADSGIDNNVINTVVGIAVGVGVLLLLALLLYLCTCRKKRKRAPRHGYFADQSHAGPTVPGNYYKSAPPNNWGGQRNGDLPPPPGHGAWQTPTPPPPQLSGAFVPSSEVSSNFSGSHGPAMPPPHPSVALGFTKNSFSYEELAAATGGFSQGNLLGQGGFGYVHQGVLPNGKEIAVKSLKAGSGQGDREFQAEVEIISRVHHRHLVSLVGYCIAGGQRLLVYEFVPNRTLEYHLHGKGRPVMDWPTRLKIAVGSAKGLAYLHEDCHPRIIHRDIKASNILLDSSFEAKVSDFGLAKLSSDTHTHVSTRVMGTFGYLAPEYAASGKLTEKSDVFSFGVMLLELITGRLPVDITADMDDSLVDWARPLCATAMENGNYDELADPRLEGHYLPHEMARMIACAGASIRHSARRRPKMSQIVRALEGDASLDHLNEGVKPGQSSIFNSASGSSDYDNSTYSADMRKFRKVALDSQDYASSEYGQTSEYGLNPSASSSDEMRRSGIVNPRHGPLAE